MSIRDSLRKSRNRFLEGIKTLFSKGQPLDDTTLERLEELLISADVGQSVTQFLVARVRDLARKDPQVGSDNVVSLLEREVTQLLSKNLQSPLWAPQGLTVWALLGMNGSGKTTSAAKLASLHKAQGKRVLLACADTFRAAASEQLDIWSKRAGVPVVLQGRGADPAAVCHDAIDSALARGCDLLLIDTAGRMHTRKDLMEELSKIMRVVGRMLPGAPHENLLVIDAPTGQNALSQAKLFSEGAKVTGIVLTKLDGSSRGGATLAVVSELKLPVKWVGTGEGIGDLEPFDPQAFASGLLEEQEAASR